MITATFRSIIIRDAEGYWFRWQRYDNSSVEGREGPFNTEEEAHIAEQAFIRSREKYGEIVDK